MNTTRDHAIMLESLVPVIRGECRAVLHAAGPTSLDLDDLIQEASVVLWEQREKVAAARSPRDYAKPLARRAAVRAVCDDLRGRLGPVRSLEPSVGQLARAAATA